MSEKIERKVFQVLNDMEMEAKNSLRKFGIRDHNIFIIKDWLNRREAVEEFRYRFKKELKKEEER